METFSPKLKAVKVKSNSCPRLPTISREAVTTHLNFTVEFHRFPKSKVLNEWSKPIYLWLGHVGKLQTLAVIGWHFAMDSWSLLSAAIILLSYYYLTVRWQHRPIILAFALAMMSWNWSEVHVIGILFRCTCALQLFMMTFRSGYILPMIDWIV